VIYEIGEILLRLGLISSLFGAILFLYKLEAC